MKKESFTPELIEQLNENEVFVFGSNKAGNHAGGAARTAVEKFGAVMGHGEGIQGQSYAIPTLDKNMEKVSLDDLQQSLFRFCLYAKKESEKTFYLTKIGMGIAGFTLDEMLEVINRVDLPSNVIIPEEFNVVYGYKGFEEDLICRGYKYKIGGDYEEESVAACHTGFHFCRNPFDVLGYYPPHDIGMRRYCTVKGSGRFDKSWSNKVASTKLHVEAEIGLDGLIKAGVKFILDRVNWKDNKGSNTGNYSAATNTGDNSAATNTGDNSAATNTGNYSAATNTGYYSAATNTGDNSAATNTGYRSAATNTGDDSAATNTGYRSAATNTGYRSAATNTGNYSAATNTGNYSAATNTGDDSAAEVSGKESVAIVTGKYCKARGTIGNWIVLTERGEWDGKNYPIIEVKAFKVDGETVKENVWYKLVDGKLVEA